MKLDIGKAKKLGKIIVLVGGIFILGGIGGVFFDQSILPMIKTNRYLSEIDFLQKTAENVTVINKTEQITIEENDSIAEVASRPATSVVSIISLANKDEFQKNSFNRLDTSEKSGSGIIATSDGVIVTYRNAILEENANYFVFLYDGNRYNAQLMGIDEFTNLAYLKIDASNLPVIAFANSNDYKAGKKLIAIGNSFGEYQTRYSSGLLSNVNKTFNLSGKSVSSTEKAEGIMETDFVGKQEYLGGPVIGFNGELVGIVGMVIIDNEEKYFEIPSNMVKQSLDLAVRGELEKRPVLGAYYSSITREKALILELPRDRGAYVYAPSGKQGLVVLSGSIADKAGLKINDIVIAVNGQEINLDNPLANLINQHKKGENIELTILRDQKEEKISIAL